MNANALGAIKVYEDVHDWLSEEEALGLYRTAKKLPGNAVIVKIGSRKGKSTICLGKGLSDGIIYAVDPFNALEKRVVLASMK